MNGIYIQNEMKQLLRRLVGTLPLALIERLGQFPSNSIAHRIAKLGVFNREVTIRQGVAAELKFTSGQSNPAYALGTNELPVQHALASHINSGDIFYDIGANVGFFTVIGARLVGASGKVYAFEPVPENTAIIRRNIELNCFENVTVIEKAVSSCSSQGELLLARYSGGSTLSKADIPSDLRGRVSIPIVAIDDLIAQNSLLPPNLVKIDVEGAELDVLKGMTKTIKAFRPIILYEIDASNANAFEQKQSILKAFMQELGYTLSELEDSYPEIGWFVGHVVATPK
jgi:FkbM family methyltransferase